MKVQLCLQFVCNHVTNFSSAIFSSAIFLHHFFRQSPTFSFVQELSTLLKCNFHLFWGGVLRCTKRRHTCSRYLSYFWRSFDDDKGDGNEKVTSIVNLRSFKLCRDSKPHPCPEWEPRKRSSRLGKVREFHTSGRSVRGAHYFLLEL